GLACGTASDLPSAFVVMRQGGLATSSGSDILSDGPTVPTIVFHGDRDVTVHPSNGDHILEQSMRTTSTQKKVHRGRVPGGHAYTRTKLDKLNEEMGKLAAYEKQMLASPDGQISLTDPDSRSM